MGMLTYTGLDFDPATYTKDMFDEEDIAHALSLNNRYNGHTAYAYSVGQHSNNIAKVLYDYNCNDETVMYGLMHDASEAYLSDVPTPMKIKLPIYTEWEKKIMDEILAGIGENISITRPNAWLKEIDFDFVHKVDRSMVPYEMRALFPNRPKELSFDDVLLLPEMSLKYQTPQEVKNIFMDNYCGVRARLYEKYKKEPAVGL